MKRRRPQPEFEALVEASSSLRASADDIEGEDISITSDDNEKWKLSKAELQVQHARAVAMRTLANELELRALDYMRRQREKTSR